MGKNDAAGVVFLSTPPNYMVAFVSKSAEDNVDILDFSGKTQSHLLLALSFFSWHIFTNTNNGMGIPRCATPSLHGVPKIRYSHMYHLISILLLLVQAEFYLSQIVH